MSGLQLCEGSISTDLVAIEARKALEGAQDDQVHEVPEPAGQPEENDPFGREAVTVAGQGAKVISLHARRLPADSRPRLPDMTKYDRLPRLPVRAGVDARRGACWRCATTR